MYINVNSKTMIENLLAEEADKLTMSAKRLAKFEELKAPELVINREIEIFSERFMRVYHLRNLLELYEK